MSKTCLLYKKKKTDHKSILYSLCVYYPYSNLIALDKVMMCGYSGEIIRVLILATLP